MLTIHIMRKINVLYLNRTLKPIVLLSLEMWTVLHSSLLNNLYVTRSFLIFSPSLGGVHLLFSHFRGLDIAHFSSISAQTSTWFQG